MLKKTMTGREVLEEALLKYCETHGDPVPRYEGEFHFSADYEQYIHALIKSSKKAPRRGCSTLGKRVAGIAAAILIAFGCSMTVSAVRSPFVSFCMNTYEKFTEIFFDASDIEKAPQTIETVYTLGYVPEGYELNSQSVEKESSFFVWHNRDGDSIKLVQNILNIKLTIDTEESDVISTNVNDFQIFFKDKYGKKTYFWNTDEYQFRLYIMDDDISTEDGIELIRSVMKYK